MTNVVLQQTGTQLTAKISGEVDHHWAELLRRQIDARVKVSSPCTLVLDFSAVTFMDSSGVGLILGRYNLVHALGGALMVQNAPAQTARMLAVAGIECKEAVSHESR